MDDDAKRDELSLRYDLSFVRKIFGSLATALERRGAAAATTAAAVQSRFETHAVHTSEGRLEYRELRFGSSHS
jgi:hypothetical protein